MIWLPHKMASIRKLLANDVTSRKIVDGGKVKVKVNVDLYSASS